jgi:hypothetical protein
VQGSAINGIGLLGTSQGGDGVQGKTTNASHSGVAGLYQSSTGAGIGVFGFSQSSAGFAVFSSGNLQVTGTPFCSGCTAFTNNSDARLKKNIESLGNPLSRLLQLRGVTFEWKEPEEHGNHAGTQRGFVAQEVEKVFPEWVGVDNKGFKTLNLTGLEPMLVESLRALKTENDALAVRVKKLEANQRPVGAGFGEGAFGLAVLGAMIGGLVISRRRVRSVL